MDFAFELTGHELARRAHVLDAIDYSPASVLAQEQAAGNLLYSGLDSEQQAIYDGLVAAGVLP